MLDKLKMLLGITDSEKDFTLQYVIDAVTDMVLNYCNIEKLPPQLENTVLSICMDKYRADSIGQKGTGTGNRHNRGKCKCFLRFALFGKR